jgi:RNA polymerase sigma-70 factor (ECF subfamily)
MGVDAAYIPWSHAAEGGALGDREQRVLAGGKPRMAAGSTPDPEAALLRRAAEGDEEAFETLFRRFERPLYAYFLRMVQDVPLAEDLVCETMTAVWRSARRFRGNSLVSTWVFGIAHHSARAALRRRKPTAPLEEADTVGDNDGPEDAAERADVAERVRRAVAELPPEHREVVLLTFDRGLSYPEIAQVLGIPVNTVKTRMFYARQKLKNSLVRLGVGHV